MSHEANFEAFEMRIITAIENDKVFIDTETTGDIHTENARRLFGVKEVTPELRRKAKEAMFCWHYGGNPSRVVR